MKSTYIENMFACKLKKVSLINQSTIKNVHLIVELTMKTYQEKYMSTHQLLDDLK